MALNATRTAATCEDGDRRESSTPASGLFTRSRLRVQTRARSSDNRGELRMHAELCEDVLM